MSDARRIVHRSGTAVGVLFALQLVAARPAAADIPNPISVVTDPLSNVLGGVGGWAFDKVAEGIAKWVLGAVEFFVNGALDFLRTSSRPNVEAAWFAGAGSPYASVRNIAGLLLVGFVFLGIIQGLVAGDPFGMLRRIVGNLPIAVAGMVVTTVVVGHLLELTDGLSNAVLANTDQQALHFLSGFGATVTGATAGFAAVLLGLVAVLAGLLLWIELIVRASLVYLLVAISPIGFAATLWPSARGFLRRTIELLLAAIFSKFVICVTLSIGVAALSGAGTAGSGNGLASDAGASVGTLLVGTVLLGLAAFSPFIVLKLIPIAEAALVAQGISRGPLRASQAGMSTAYSASMLTRLAGGRASGLPGQSGGGASAGPTPGGAAAAPSPTPTSAGSSGAAGAGAAAGAAPASAAGPAALAGAAVVGAASKAGRSVQKRVDATASASAPERPSSTSDAPTRPRKTE
jgi:hypothetical protein